MSEGNQIKFIKDEYFEKSVSDPLDFWREKQRELVTNVVDYNLNTLVSLISNETISLFPVYQRRFRWDKVRQSRLIESFLMNVPVPPIFLNEDEYGSYSVIDGKQRLSSIVEFFRGRLKLSGLEIFQDINDLTIDDLPSTLRRVLETRPTLRAVIILRQSDPDIKFEVFRRLNTGGVRLNAQEVRNSVFPGPLNDLIMQLSENKQFHNILGIKTKSKSKVWQEMRDAEFVLRFFTFKDNWLDFSSGMKRSMDEFMDDFQNASEDLLNKLQSDFFSTLDLIDHAFGERAFRRWLPDRDQWRRQVQAALFDAEIFSIYGFPQNSFRAQRVNILEEIKTLFLDEEFNRSIKAGTNTPSFFRYRIRAVQEILNHYAI